MINMQRAGVCERQRGWEGVDELGDDAFAVTAGYMTWGCERVDSFFRKEDELEACTRAEVLRATTVARCYSGVVVSVCQESSVGFQGLDIYNTTQVSYETRVKLPPDLTANCEIGDESLTVRRRSRKAEHTKGCDASRHIYDRLSIEWDRANREKAPSWHRKHFLNCPIHGLEFHGLGSLRGYPARKNKGSRAGATAVKRLTLARNTSWVLPYCPMILSMEH